MDFCRDMISHMEEFTAMRGMTIEDLEAMVGNI